MKFQLIKNDELKCELSYIQLDGDIWFRGQSVAKAIGYSKTNTAKAVQMHVDDDDRRRFDSLCNTSKMEVLQNPPKQGRSPIMINESGMYSLIIASKHPKAKKFRRWLTSEVLPSIRKTGKYDIRQSLDPLADRRLTLEERKHELEELKMFKEMCNEFGDDVRVAAAAKDAILQKLTGQKTITNGDDVYSMDISEIAKKCFSVNLNHVQKIKLGKFLKKEFEEVFPGVEIKKSKRWVNGSMRDVRSYPKEYEEWIIDTLNEHGDDFINY